MTAAALNTEVFYQLSLIADDVNYLQKTLDFIKSLTKKSKLRGREYVELLRQLSDFQEYDRGWDGLSAVPLTRLSIKNFKEVLNDSRDEDLSGWSISPEINGTILLESENSAINIGDSQISYFINNNGVVEGENSLPFSSNKVIGIMRKANNYDRG